jgi:hypothetical protein
MKNALLNERENIRNTLYQKLLDANAFWSYDMSNMQSIPDRTLIAETIIHLDIEEIKDLFRLFPKSKIKKVWRDDLVIQGDYYHNLNRLIAWLFFDIKMPDRYIRTTITNHIKKLERECTD